jgi:hypothetical protein
VIEEEVVGFDSILLSSHVDPVVRRAYGAVAYMSILDGSNKKWFDRKDMEENKRSDFVPAYNPESYYRLLLFLKL